MSIFRVSYIASGQRGDSYDAVGHFVSCHGQYLSTLHLLLFGLTSLFNLVSNWRQIAQRHLIVFIEVDYNCKISDSLNFLTSFFKNFNICK